MSTGRRPVGMHIKEEYTMATTTSPIRLSLGSVRVTPGVRSALTPNDLITSLARHFEGDWGEGDEHDWKQNDDAVNSGLRILSSYVARDGVKFWIITEHDRSATTILLPNEY